MAKEYAGIMYDSFEAAATVTKQYDFQVQSIAIINDGPADVVLDVGYVTVRVKPAETFDEQIIPIKEFTISASGAYRCIVRGAG